MHICDNKCTLTFTHTHKQRHTLSVPLHHQWMAAYHTATASLCQHITPTHSSPAQENALLQQICSRFASHQLTKGVRSSLCARVQVHDNSVMSSGWFNSKNIAVTGFRWLWLSILLTFVCLLVRILLCVKARWCVSLPTTSWIVFPGLCTGERRNTAWPIRTCSSEDVCSATQRLAMAWSSLQVSVCMFAQKNNAFGVCCKSYPVSVCQAQTPS